MPQQRSIWWSGRCTKKLGCGRHSAMATTPPEQRRPLLRPGPRAERPRSQQGRGEPGRRFAMSGPAFDYTLDFKATDFRQRPDLYRTGRGEQGVLLVEPYKGEILPHWRFKTVAEARKSSAEIYQMFLAYLKAE